MENDDKEINQKPFQGDKWLYYQDVKPTGKKVELTEKDKEDIDKWVEYIYKEMEEENNL